MNRTAVAAALAALFLLPVATDAQFGSPIDRSPRLRVTAFGAFLPAFDRQEQWAHRGDFLSNVHATVHIAGGGAAGINIESALTSRFGINVSIAAGRRGQTLFDVPEVAETFRIGGTDFLLGRAGFVVFVQQQPGMAMHRVTGSLFAGGTLLYERPIDELGTRDILDPSATHPGLHVGGTLEVPFASDRLALQLGVEDNLIFWDEEALTALAWEYFGQPGERSDTDIEFDFSHAFLIRAGLSFRFR